MPANEPPESKPGDQDPKALTPSPIASGAERFVLLPTTRYVAWVAVALGAAMAALSPLAWARAAGALASLLLILSQLVLRARRPVLIVDESGYRVEVSGRVRFRVGWTEVRRVLRDPAEEALYLDCGDRARNLLLPPRTGFAFTFTDRERLYLLLNARVGRQAQDVARFDRSLPSAPSPPSDTQKGPVSA